MPQRLQLTATPPPPARPPLKSITLMVDAEATRRHQTLADWLAEGADDKDLKRLEY